MYLDDAMPAADATGTVPAIAPTAATVIDMIAARRQHGPGSVTILDSAGQSLTAAALEENIHAVGARLAAHGLGLGDRIALILPSGIPGAAWLMGVLAYATAVPLNPELTAAEFQRLFLQLRIKAIAIGPDMNGAIRAVAAAMDITVIEIDSEPRPERPLATAARPNGPHDNVLILLTSGTTAKPKVVAIPSAKFMAGAANDAAILGLGPDDICLNVMPLFHAHGINNGLMAPLIAGGRTICAARYDPDRFFPALVELQPTWYTASFTIHLAVLAAVTHNKGAIDGHRLRFIRSGSGAIAAETVTQLEEIFRVPLIVTYASTETWIVSATPMTPGDRKPGSAGRPKAGTAVIVDDDGRYAPPGIAGEILVRCPHMVIEYEGDPEATAKVVTDDGWFRTGDFGRLDADGTLSITGRLKEMINRGGEKIAPAEIELALTGHPAVLDAAAFGFTHPTLGEEVAAAVVLEPGATDIADEIKGFAQRQLAPFKVPKRIVIVDTIPRGPTGKPQRLILAESYDLGPTGDAPPVTPPAADVDRTETEAILARIWADELGRDTVGLDDDFFVLGGDSIQAARVFLRIEEELGHKCPISELLGAGTVRGLARLLDSDRRTKSLVAIRPSGRGTSGPSSASMAATAMC